MCETAVTTYYILNMAQGNLGRIEGWFGRTSLTDIYSHTSPNVRFLKKSYKKTTEIHAEF